MWVDLGKIIVATGFEWFPKLQKIAQSGHNEATVSTTGTVPSATSKMS